MVTYDTPINATDASFERVVLNASLPVVAVFWQAGQVPRQQLNDVLEETAQAYAGEALVVKLDVSDAPRARVRYEVETLPQFLFFNQRKLVARAKGMPTAEMLKPWMEYLLGRGPKPVTKKARPEPEQAGGVHPIEVTDATFDQVVLGAGVPALVDFWASWCGPCRTVAPTVEALAREFAGRAVVAKLDVDANQATAGRYGVRSIPTLIFFRDGEAVDRVVGAQPIQVLRQKLQQLLCIERR